MYMPCSWTSMTRTGWGAWQHVTIACTVPKTSTTSFFNSFSFIFVTGTGTLTLTQEQAEMANGYDALMRDALAASQCSGCLPDPSREAYAFVTWGSKKADGSLGGLRAAVASIRLHDTTRDIVVLDVVEDEMASVSPSLVALSQRFRVRRVAVPPIPPPPRTIMPWNVMRRRPSSACSHALD